jgi:hypothetical protein
MDSLVERHPASTAAVATTDSEVCRSRLQGPIVLLSGSFGGDEEVFACAWRWSRRDARARRRACDALVSAPQARLFASGWVGLERYPEGSEPEAPSVLAAIPDDWCIRLPRRGRGRGRRPRRRRERLLPVRRGWYRSGAPSRGRATRTTRTTRTTGTTGAGRAGCAGRARWGRGVGQRGYKCGR